MNAVRHEVAAEIHQQMQQYYEMNEERMGGESQGETTRGVGSVMPFSERRPLVVP